MTAGSMFTPRTHIIKDVLDRRGAEREEGFIVRRLRCVQSAEEDVQLTYVFTFLII